MARLRPPRLPADVGRHLGRRERVLAAAPLEGGEWAVITPSHLALVATDAVRWRRAWHEVDHGSWDEVDSIIRIRWVDGRESVLPLAPAAGPSFPEAFRERVQSSVVHVERLELRPGVTVRAVVRRDGEGGLLSQVITEGPVTTSRADTQAVLDLESRARRAVGLPG